ncbi:hypothetical protein J11TS1_05930 [Oceanobacillus sp. J11TS1]|nr:hypothetical protein J11TS1_05930 [Oceanobacillus sp. J11TS1]
MVGAIKGKFLLREEDIPAKKEADFLIQFLFFNVIKKGLNAWLKHN